MVVGWSASLRSERNLDFFVFLIVLSTAIVVPPPPPPRRLTSHRLSEHNEDAFVVVVGVDGGVSVILGLGGSSGCGSRVEWEVVLLVAVERGVDACRLLPPPLPLNIVLLRMPSIRLLNEWLRWRFIERDDFGPLAPCFNSLKKTRFVERVFRKLKKF